MWFTSYSARVSCRGTFFLFPSLQPLSSSRRKSLIYITLLIAASPKYLRENVELTWKRELKVFPQKGKYCNIWKIILPETQGFYQHLQLFPKYSIIKWFNVIIKEFLATHLPLIIVEKFNERKDLHRFLPKLDEILLFFFFGNISTQRKLYLLVPTMCSVYFVYCSGLNWNHGWGSIIIKFLMPLTYLCIHNCGHGRQMTFSPHLKHLLGHPMRCPLHTLQAVTLKSQLRADSCVQTLQRWSHLSAAIRPAKPG